MVNHIKNTHSKLLKYENVQQITMCQLMFYMCMYEAVDKTVMHNFPQIC